MGGVTTFKTWKLTEVNLGTVLKPILNLNLKRILACGSLIKRKEKSNVLYNWLQRAFYINCKFKLILKWITMTPVPPSTTLRLLELLLVPLNLKGTSCFIQEHFLFQSCHDDARQWLANERWHSDSQEEEMEWRFMQSRRERNAIKRCQAFTPPFDELASCERLHYSILSAIRPGLKSVRLLLSSTRSPASIFLGSHRLVFHSVPTPLPGSHNSETKKNAAFPTSSLSLMEKKVQQLLCLESEEEKQLPANTKCNTFLELSSLFFPACSLLPGVLDPKQQTVGVCFSSSDSRNAQHNSVDMEEKLLLMLMCNYPNKRCNISIHASLI